MKKITYDSLVDSKWFQSTIDYIICEHGGVLCDDLMNENIVNPCFEDGSYEEIASLLFKILKKYLPQNLGHCEKCVGQSEDEIEHLAERLREETGDRL